MRTAEEIYAAKNRKAALDWYYAHREYCLERQKAYYRKNKERIAEQRKKYAAKRKDELKEYDREYYEKVTRPKRKGAV